MKEECIGNDIGSNALTHLTSRRSALERLRTWNRGYPRTRFRTYQTRYVVFSFIYIPFNLSRHF